MRETLSLLKLRSYQNIFNCHYFRLIKYWGIKCIITDTWFDLYNFLLKMFGYCIVYKWCNSTQKDIKSYERCTPLLRRTQWWVSDAGDMCQTTWWRVLTGVHKGQYKKLDRP